MEETKKELQYRSKGDDPEYTPGKYIAEHTVGGDETLSHIALKYYGSAAKEKWMVIYEANKALIGDDPSKIRSGLVLKIPELP
jgi:nucleoid-associated protein YgaU